MRDEAGEIGGEVLADALVGQVALGIERLAGTRHHQPIARPMLGAERA